MGNSNKWLEKRKKRQLLIARISNILVGSLIVAIVIGPLIYFGAVAVPLELREARSPKNINTIELPATPDVAIEIPATPELKTSNKPIEFPKPKKPVEKINNAKVEIQLSDLPVAKQKLEEVEIARPETTESKFLNTLKNEFRDTEKDVKIKTTKKEIEGQEEKIITIQNLDIDDGPRKVQKEDQADIVARAALRKYLKTNPKEADIDIYQDTSKLKNSNKTYQLVLSNIKTHDSKWYVTFQQYKEGLPVFDGNFKMIFTERKKLIAITDNIRIDIPDIVEFDIQNSIAEASAKELFDWDEEKDEIKFINKGYLKNKTVFKIDVESHNPLGEYEVYIDAKNAQIESVKGDIRLADSIDDLPDIVDDVLYSPDEEDPNSIIPEDYNAEDQLRENLIKEQANDQLLFPTRDGRLITKSEIFEEIIAPVYAEIVPEEVLPEIEITSLSEELVGELPATPDLSATPDLDTEIEPSIIILDTILSQVLGKIYPENPNQEAVITPLSDAYVYYNQNQIITDKEGYFENKDLDWYSTFLEGPYVVVYDDDASSDAEIKDRTPEDPFVWDENSASLAAINAFYHTNKMHEYFAEKHNFDINKQIPLTVNSELVDLYINGCGAWFDNSNKTIEMGRGGTDICPDDLNYALSSDFIFHEYAHFVVEEITHLPNITGSEAAAMGEGLADYFAATINNDPLWGDVVAPNDTRNLKNTLNYQFDMTGESHRDGQIFAGALWDLRTLIGPIETDRLIFNTLYQDRLHFETFMYGLLIEDDDNEDFSDGTPHMLEIIAAFQNHGIGPGIENFDGLPVDPEAWSELLGEEAPEGDEDSILNALNSGCSSYDDGLTIIIDANVTCYWTGSGSRSSMSISNGGDLYIGDSSTSGALTISGDAFINSAGGLSSIRAGWYATPYGSLSVGDEFFVRNGSYVYIGYDSGAGANTNSWLQTASTQIYETSTSYTAANFVAIYGTGNVFARNNLNSVYIGRTDTSTSYEGDDSYLYIASTGEAITDAVRADNQGYIRIYGQLNSGTNSDLRDGAYMHIYSSGTYNNSGTTMFVYNTSYIENDGSIINGSFEFNNSSYLQQDSGTAGGSTYTFDDTSYADINGGSLDPTSATFNVSSYADVDGTGNFSPTTGTFNNNSYMTHRNGTSTTAVVDLNGNSRWYHLGGSTSGLVNFNITDTAQLQPHGGTITITNINLSGTTAAINKSNVDPNKTGVGSISASYITLSDTSRVNHNIASGSITASTRLVIDDNSYYSLTAGTFTTPLTWVRGTTVTSQSGELDVTGGTFNSTNLRCFENGWIDQGGGTISVSSSLTLESNACLYDMDGGNGSFNRLEMTNDSEIQNDNGAITIGGFGAVLYDSALISNNSGGSITMDSIASQSMYLLDNAEFNNYGTLTMDIDNSNGDFLDITESSWFRNYGDAQAWGVRVGWEDPVEGDKEGGTLYNYHDSTNGYGQLLATDDLQVFRGTFENRTGDIPTSGVEVRGHVYVTGEVISSACFDGTFRNFGDMDVEDNIYLNDCSDFVNRSRYESVLDQYDDTAVLDIGGSLIASGSEIDLNNIGGTLDIENDLTVTVANTVSSTQPAFDNENEPDGGSGVFATGVIEVYDDMLIEASGAYAVDFDNDGTVLVQGDTTSTSLEVDLSSQINNSSTGTITVDTASTAHGTRGQLRVFNDAYLTNAGTLNANHLYIGDGSINGGTFSNTYEGTTNVTYNSFISGYAMMCIDAYCSHSASDAGDANLNIDGILAIGGSASYPTTFYMSRDADLMGVRIADHAELDISNISQTVNVKSGWESYIFDDQNATTPGNDGLLDINDGNIFDSTTADIILGEDYGGGFYTGGNIDNDGTLYADSLILYASSEVTNQDNRDVIVNNTLELSGDDESFERRFFNHGHVESDIIEVKGDDAIYNNNAGYASDTDANDLMVDGGQFRVELSADADIVDNTYVLWENNTNTSGSLYNFNTFSTGILHVGVISTTAQGGYVQNGSSTTTATFTVGTGGVELYGGGGAVPAGYGKILNKRGTFSVGNGVDGQISIAGSSSVGNALFQNSDYDTDLNGILNVDVISMDEYSDFVNYGDLNFTESWITTSSTGEKSIINYELGDIDGVDTFFSNNTTLDNYDSGQIDLTGTFGIYTTDGSATINNHSHIESVKMQNGSFSPTYRGGVIDNEALGEINITSTSTDAAEIYWGTINLLQNSAGFDVAGRLSIRGGSGSQFDAGAVLATDGVSFDRPTSTFGELYIYENGSYITEDSVFIDDSGPLTGDLYIEGGTVLKDGLFQIDYTAGGVLSNKLEVKGSTTIEDYGTLIGLSPSEIGSYFDYDLGVQAIGPVTVSDLGSITSDTDSNFYFYSTVDNAGTISLQDNVRVGGVYTQTGGTTVIGDETNVGLAYFEDLIDVQGGTFTTYNYGDNEADGGAGGNEIMHGFNDIKVDGLGSKFEFANDDGSGSFDCYSNISGYLDIFNDGRVYINCATSPAVEVESNSPGGNTQVEGTLYINTNLTTETMQVGTATNSGLVTHDIYPYDFPTPVVGEDEVFHLTVTDELTVSTNGELNVDGKSGVIFDTLTANWRGGSLGGRGQSNVVTPRNEEGSSTIANTIMGRCGEDAARICTGLGGGIMNIKAGSNVYELDYESQTAEFTVGATVSGGFASGEILHVYDDGDEGSLIIRLISANGFGSGFTITDDDGGSATAANPQRTIMLHKLNYTGQTSNFTIGDSLTGPSGTATILDDKDDGATGTLTIYVLTGTFSDTQSISDESGGDGTVSGSLLDTGRGVMTLNNTTEDSISADGTDIGYRATSLDYNSETANFTVGAILTGPSGSGYIIYLSDSGTTGRLYLEMISGTFTTGQAITDDQGGAATTSSNLTTVVDDTSGSGGAINIYAYNTITGAGDITANGGQDVTGSNHGAGGGGRIYIEHWQEDTFDATSPDHTGIVQAVGGPNTNISSFRGGVGTILKKWYHQWGNHNDGTLILDAFTYKVDVDADGTQDENYSGSRQDETAIDLTTSPGVESLQLENNAIVSIASGSYMQQCLDDGAGSTYFFGAANYNRDSVHTTVSSSSCLASPDPPATLYINNSGTGALTGENGEFFYNTPVDYPHIEDVSPATTALHKEGRFDSDGTAADSPLQEARQFQLQISDNERDLYRNNGDATGLVTGCNIDATAFPSPGYLNDDGSSRINYELPSTCANNLTGGASPGQRYYYRYRFLEDTDNTNTVSSGDLWGLWSETNSFYIDEAGYITFKKCNNKVADLDYDGQSVGNDFTVGETLTGPSGTATILNDIDNGADGTLTIQIISGSFADNDAITDSGGGAATAASNENHKFYLGTYDSSEGDNVFSDYCNFDTEATVPIYIKASKNQGLTHTVNTLVSLWDMASLDYDPPDSSGGLDGIRYFDIDYGSQTGVFTVGATLSSATGSGRIISDSTPGIGDGTLSVRLQSGYFSNGDSLTDGITGAATATSSPLDDYDNEVGFHTDNLTGSLISQISNAGTFYHTNYTFLPNTPTTIIDSNSGYSNQSFSMWLSAFIHGLIPHPTDPINNDPTGTCGYFNLLLGQETHDTCTSLSGTYTATVTVTASATP